MPRDFCLAYWLGVTVFAGANRALCQCRWGIRVLLYIDESGSELLRHRIVCTLF